MGLFRVIWCQMVIIEAKKKSLSVRGSITGSVIVSGAHQGSVGFDGGLLEVVELSVNHQGLFGSLFLSLYFLLTFTELLQNNAKPINANCNKFKSQKDETNPQINNAAIVLTGNM